MGREETEKGWLYNRNNRIEPFMPRERVHTTGLTRGMSKKESLTT